MLNKTILLLLICFLVSCGYKPLYLKKDTIDIPIINWEFEGDRKINKIFASQLKAVRKTSTAKGYEVKLNSQKLLEVVSKDKNGDPSMYRTSLIVNFELIENDIVIRQREFNANFTYNNNKNKFELKQYQKSIEGNLINEIVEKIFIFLKS